MAEKTYNVLNYTTSPISLVINRYDSILIAAGSDDEPTAYPLTEAEILFANNSTEAFKSGMLRFEPEYEAELYELCRIRNWKDIMTNKQIEDIFINFNLEDFKNKVIQITSSSYFDRIYGVFMGLKNAGVSMSNNIEQAMSLRYSELTNGIKKTKILLTPTNNTEETDGTKSEVARLKEELAALKEMLANSRLDSLQNNAEVNQEVEVPNPKTTTVTRKKTTKKATITKEDNKQDNK